MVFRRHRHTAEPQALECGMPVEQRVVFGVHVKKIEGPRVGGEVLLDVTNEAAEEAIFERVKEVCEQRLLRHRHAGCVVLMQQERSEHR